MSRIMSPGRALACVAAALFVPAAPAQIAGAAVTAERIEYHGWKGCWKLSNGTVDLVYVPVIGRVMRYGRIGGPNILWEKQDMRGKLPIETKDWQNFGGDKVWPGPQTVWGWPPDPEIDPGSHEVRLLKNGRLLVTGRASQKSGVRFEREIAMDERGTGVRIVNRMINTSDKPVKWAPWEIAQVDEPDVAVIPRSPASVHSVGYYAFPDNPPAAEQLTVGERTVEIRRSPTKSAKIGTYSEQSRAEAQKGDVKFTITVEEPAAPSREYPHGGSRQEIYTNPDPDKYVEIELLGPVRELRPGESSKLVTRWTLSGAGRSTDREIGRGASR